MASANIRDLEARIRADRLAVRESRRRLREAAEHRLSRPSTLLGGFAAGLAGGWLLKGPNRDKEVRRLRRELDRRRAQGESEASARKGTLMSLLPLVTMGVRLASALRGAEPQPHAEDSAAGGGPV